MSQLIIPIYFDILQENKCFEQRWYLFVQAKLNTSHKIFLSVLKLMDTLLPMWCFKVKNNKITPFFSQYPE